MSDRPGHFREPTTTIQRGDIIAMYSSRDTDPLHRFLRDAYKPPEIFEHGRETLVAEVAGEPDGGYDVRVFETRAPAAFYVVEARGFRLRTGSGHMATLVVENLVTELSRGMLVVESTPPKEWVDCLVNRFLAWPLPESVFCDACATKAGTSNRSGTNLLTAYETRQMFLHVLGGG